MGLMVDTNVFIRFEKSGKPIDFSLWESSQKVYISAVIVSELLMYYQNSTVGGQFVELYCHFHLASFVVQAARLHVQASRLYHDSKVANFKRQYDWEGRVISEDRCA